MLKKILFFIITINVILFGSFYTTNANRECTSLGPSDSNTFKEYCYKITDAYLSLRNRYKVDGKIDSYLVGRILNYSKQGLNYLPDDLVNKNFYTHLQTAIERGIKEPSNNSNFEAISIAIDDFLNKTIISQVSGDIEVIPATGSAPLTVTLRSNIKEPTGTKLENYNYVWWILERGKRRNIGTGPFINYTFMEEGNYSIFLDVTSNHRNSSGKSDVIPFSKKVDISVTEKVASLMLKVNSKNLDASDELKFSPEDSIYGLIFDATSSVPTSGTKFVKTSWNFGNGIIRTYDSAPKIERIVYANEGEYKVSLVLTTNTGRTVERNFNIVVRNPISTINVNSLEGYMGDKFTFTANSFSRNDTMSYTWEIVDLKNDKVIFNKSLTTFTYTFPEKGRYNVKLAVTSASGQRDYDNKIIHINSRPPVAAFNVNVPNKNRPNTIYLNATSSYDLDSSDDGKLEFSWIIGGERVELDNANFNGSTGNYTFSEVGEQSITLEVRDPDDLMTQINKKVSIESLLSVDFFIFPNVTQVGNDVKFSADAPKAKFFEWSFGDGIKVGGDEGNITHKFSQAGTYTVTLTVRDENDNENKFSRLIYVGDANSPLANINVGSGTNVQYPLVDGVCNGNPAYIINKVDNTTLSGAESIDITGLNTGLNYTWKVGEKFFSSQQLTQKFDDIGCIPVKLTVKSQKNGGESSSEIYLKVENIKPTLTGLDVSVKDLTLDPVIVDVKALGAVDRDGVIQSYLWYYYTDSSSDPQDFRATTSPSTTFVLPKITGTYYFVAVLKDNNEERFSSEELNSKYYVTLTGDNLNTPIISFSVNNSSIKVGEEVVFTANVGNILGQNLNNSKDVKYSWDFDGDGFYDLETDKNIVSYKFKSSGEKRVKLKVKNKGFSNTKTVTVNVSNILKPDFDYISIGNTYVFFDKSQGSAERYSWNMGDGQVLDKKGSFSYTYTDGKPVHLVKLTLEEAGNKKEITKKVTRDFQKMIDDRKQTLSILSNYAINNDKIVLKEEVSDLQLFIRSSLPNVKYFAVDYNIDIDSDLNGGKDDDVDNKNTASYTSGGPVLVELNNLKTQKIKIFLKDEAEKVLESKIITIEKEYIENKVINSDEIKLDGVSNSLRNTFDKIKLEVEKLEPESRLKSLSYLQRLREEWQDDREKTNIIMEFSGFITDLNSPNSEEIVNLLEGLLVEDREDKTEFGIVLSALQKIIPKDIVCTPQLVTEAQNQKISCYELLNKKLETISKNNDIEENKKLGKEILEVISADKTMSNQEKLDFKALLSKLIEKGNISEETRQEAEQSQSSSSTDSGSSIFSTIIKYLLYVVAGIIGLIFIGVIIYGISLLLNKRKSFDSEKFNLNDLEKEDILLDEKEEVIKKDDFDPLSETEKDIKTEPEKVPDWLKGSFSETESKENIDYEKSESNISETKKEEEESLEINNNLEVPDWLTGGNSSEETSEVKEEFKEEENTSEPKKEEEESLEINNSSEVPDWLTGGNSSEETSELKEEFKEEENILEPKKEEEESLGINNNSGDINLLESFDISSEDKLENYEQKLETKEELDEFTKIKLDEEEPKKEDNLPDWLKGSVSNISDKKEEKVEIKKSRESDDFSIFDSLPEEKIKKEKTSKTKRKTSKKTETSNQNKDEKLNKGNSKSSKDEELWDDGMKIPDWLKTDSDK